MKLSKKMFFDASDNNDITDRDLINALIITDDQFKDKFNKVLVRDSKEFLKYYIEKFILSEKK